MNENPFPFLQSELDYRRDRLRSGVVGRKARRTRFPRVRRAAVPTDDIR